ncbi:hypothetical protein [Paenibacillus thiaminolyticus]|uniref:Leucine-rich repeat domain-containing protein n=1 Tax=Paenibacillus thiaminolyticus TaxID=49283 RepID=A0A3A3GFV6_PANTH|nr:hypothetical protein [Paenibacillus thiaminolyticus]RJG22739.1 hypothetical protein DQX05_15940 [Paenibacillus thiaminolyticus]
MEDLSLVDNVGGIDEAGSIFKLSKLKRLRLMDSNVYGDMSGISYLRELEELRIQIDSAQATGLL